MYVSEDKGNDDCTDVCGTLLLSESVHKNVGRTHDSVSYTHLDVYKRQVYTQWIWASHVQRGTDRPGIRVTIY